MTFFIPFYYKKINVFDSYAFFIKMIAHQIVLCDIDRVFI
ncbi:hypothetical protein BN1088_1430756 [Sphingobacterium sp. PM2-P1-29]|nr:hypothetical protein BN1088_1430756 [Sphingobacterium sp. PM2-P1-29]